MSATQTSELEAKPQGTRPPSPSPAQQIQLLRWVDGTSTTVHYGVAMRPPMTAAALLCLALTGCGDGHKTGVTAAPSPSPCVRFGDRCELSPGKLGACVEKTGCTGAGCLVCQSQH